MDKDQEDILVEFILIKVINIKIKLELEMKELQKEKDYQKLKGNYLKNILWIMIL